MSLLALGQKPTLNGRWTACVGLRLPDRYARRDRKDAPWINSWQIWAIEAAALMPYLGATGPIGKRRQFSLGMSRELTIRPKARRVVKWSPEGHAVSLSVAMLTVGKSISCCIARRAWYKLN
jgi:hypothetical protein